jgi:RNA polymerase sigma-70 factor (ECF subfamily)
MWDSSSSSDLNVRFQTTHWSLVLAAGRRPSNESREALASLCARYWYPLYAFVRRKLDDPHQAQDLTQEFFAQLLERNSLAVAEPGRGRFRAFLLTSFKNFLSNESAKARTKKKGGGKSPIPLDFVLGETRYSREPADELTPERLYDRQWALTLLGRVLDRLQDEFQQAGKLRQFEVLKPFVSATTKRASYSEAARELGMGEGATKVAAHRLRRRYRQLLRAEISQTVSEPGQIDEEIRNLFSALATIDPRRIF